MLKDPRSSDGCHPAVPPARRVAHSTRNNHEDRTTAAIVYAPSPLRPLASSVRGIQAQSGC